MHQSNSPRVFRGDFIRLRATTTDTTGELTLAGRIHTHDDKTATFDTTLTFAGTGVQTAVTLPLADGYLTGFSVYVSSGTITDGEVQASVDVMQGSGNSATVVATLASGEVTNVRSLGLNGYT